MREPRGIDSASTEESGRQAWIGHPSRMGDSGPGVSRGVTEPLRLASVSREPRWRRLRWAIGTFFVTSGLFEPGPLVAAISNFFALELPSEPVVGRTPDASSAMGREDRETFSRLYASQAPRIYRFLRDLLFDGALARDGTQETFARSLRHMDVLRENERAIPWLFGVARKVSLELRKSRARQSRVLQDDPEGIHRERAVSCDCPEATLVGRETQRALSAALRELSEDRRALLLLRLDHGLSYEEIATSMGLSLAKVKVELFRARAALRARLEEENR